MLPVVVVGGLHTDARRAAVERLLRRVPGSVALHHDLSTASSGSVTRTLRTAGGPVEESQAGLVNDCACCALREDLLPQLERLAQDGSFRLAVVDLWDSVEPRSTAELIASQGDGLRLAGVLTAVDPALVLPCLGCGDDLADAGLAAARSDRRTIADTWARQLEYPALLALADGPEPADETDLELLRQLHPTARHVHIHEADFASLATAGIGCDTGVARERQHPACALLPQEAAAHGVATLVWRSRRPFHPERLYAALEELTCAAVRSRGRFWLADRPGTLLAWDAAGGALCVESAGPWLAGLPDTEWESVPASCRVAAALRWHPEHGDRDQHLVFVSPGLDAAAVSGLLDSCRLTDAEFAAGPDAWRTLPSAFDEFLDPVG